MSYHQHPYLSGKISRDSDPLFRYFPAIPVEVLSVWLEREIKLNPPGWVIDPFGTSPFLSLELAQKGYRVLTACNNPVIIFMLRILARAPGEAEFKAALSELSKIRRGDEWFEQHLKSLYITECPVCRQTATSLFYLWKKSETTPDFCTYHCDNCGADGEKLCNQRDYDILTQLGNTRLHRARALQRVTDLNSKNEKDVDVILDNYLTRPLYFITTLINKLEGSSIPQERKDLLYALILTICDQGNSLWSYPSTRTQPKQLIIPPSFREVNLWKALETAIDFWVGQPKPVDIVDYPESPGNQGGICLFSNRFKSIESLPEMITPKAAICIYPRPNQAFWTLSALWSGWLWGKDAVTPMQTVFERKRYDWSWLDNALESTLSHLAHLLPTNTPVLGIVSELDLGFIFSSVHAASKSGFNLDAASLNEDDEILQLWWRNNIPAESKDQNIFQAIQNSITSFLSQSAEPVSYLKLYTNTLLDITNSHQLDYLKPKNNVSLFKQFQNEFEKTIISDRHISKYPADNPNPENSRWGLLSPAGSMSLSDYVEMEVVNYLNRNPSQDYNHIENHIFEHFPGLLSPSRELIKNCLDSYAEEVSALPGFPGKWVLHSRENPTTRKTDIQEMINVLTRIGNQAGFQVADHNPLLWLNNSGEIEFVFYIMASSIISRFIYTTSKKAQNRMIVLPGSRSKLLSYKIQSDLNLAHLVEVGNWRFIKFRHIRALSQ
jgi:hypothetical protein